MTDNECVAEDTPTCVICGDEMSRDTGTDCSLCRHLGGLGMPYKYRKAKRSYYGEKMQIYFESIENLYIHGTVGNGKSWFMATIMREAVRRSVYRVNSYDETIGYSRDFLFASLPEITMKLKDSMNSQSAYTELGILDRYSKVPVLFLDDVGADYTTDYVRTFMYLLMERRGTGRGLTTVITSNFSLDELGKKAQERISSRITGMCKAVKMPGPDRRKKKV